MFKVLDLSPMLEGTLKQGQCAIGWLELPPDYGGRFRNSEVLAVTMRYIILRGRTRRQGKTIPAMDLFIGVTAKTYGLPILTRDSMHFGRIPGLVVEPY